MITFTFIRESVSHKVSVFFHSHHPFLLFILTHTDFPLGKYPFLTLSLCESSKADITLKQVQLLYVSDLANHNH